jgi:hypothetical protein
VNEMKNRPFALVGVNSDKDLEEIRTIVKEKDLNWRSFQNQPEGATKSISSAWSVRGWPTMVILDEEMRIHYIGHDGDKAIEKAKQLVKNLESKTTDQDQ